MEFEAPLTRWRERIRPEWLDGNGHMNVAYYTLVFDHGTDAFLDAVDLGFAYRDHTGKSTFAVEAHVTHQHEVGVDEEVMVTTQLLGHDAKRMHYFHIMKRISDGLKLATLEQMSLHVNLATRRVEAMPDVSQALLARMMRAHARLPPPAEQGHVIAMPTKPRAL
jgi:acyl-CoA thioester hydrolase